MLPNGISISFPLMRADTPLHRIKSELWKEAPRYSLFHLLGSQNEYGFVVVSSKGGVEELMDEAQSLFDIKPVRPYLKVVKRQGDKEAKLLNSNINILIGKSITGNSKNEEVNEFRSKCIELCDKISYQRGRSSWERRAIYTYPPEYENDEEVPTNIRDKLALQANRLHITLSIMKNTSNTFEVPDNIYPKDLIDTALRKRTQTMKLTYQEKADDYVLKVVGRLNFFLGQIIIDEDGKEKYIEKPIMQYKVIFLFFSLKLIYFHLLAKYLLCVNNK